MNPYKAAWMLHANQIRPQKGPIVKSKQKKSSSYSDEFFDEVVEQSTDWVVEHAVYIALTYMATAHNGKLRTVGSIGLRLIPYIAVAGIAYSVYKLFD
jgi:hypothetical protein